MPPVDPDDPWANDQLERKALGEYLTRVIATTSQPFVISLNSPYGTGKTYFLQCWKQHLANEGFRSVYFNAWETDFSEDALLAFMSSIKRQLSDGVEEATADTVNNHFTELAKIAGGLSVVARKFLPVIAKGIAGKALGSDPVGEIIDLSNATEGEIAELFGELVAEGLHSQERAEESVQAFKTYLAEIVVELTADAEDEQKKNLSCLLMNLIVAVPHTPLRFLNA